MNNINNFLSSVSQANTVEGNGNVFTQNMTNLDEIAEIVRAIQMNPLDSKKLLLLKKELLALSKNNDIPMTVQMKMKPLIKALESVQDDSADANKKLWDILRPYIGDVANLSTIVSLFGDHGGTILAVLRKIFFHA